MDKSWYSKYLGIPFECNHYDFKSCDCGGLVLLVLKNELGFEMPRLNNCVNFNSKEKHEAIQAYLPYFVEIERDEIQPFDIFFQLASNNTVFHCGVFVDKNKTLQATLDRGVILAGTLGLKNAKFYRIKNA